MVPLHPSPLAILCHGNPWMGKLHGSLHGSTLNAQVGWDFEAEVWASCGKSISYSGPPNSGEFFLLSSFSCNGFRLSEANVSSCLHAC